MKVVIFDLDGTLRTEEQSEHLHPKDPTIAANWLEWQDHINSNGSVIGCNKALYDLCHDFGHKVIMLTSSQSGTERWLSRNNIKIPYEIIERHPRNDRDTITFKAAIIKKLIKSGFEITHWVDNSRSMCEFVKSNYPDVNVNLV